MVVDAPVQERSVAERKAEQTPPPFKNFNALPQAYRESLRLLVHPEQLSLLQYVQILEKVYYHEEVLALPENIRSMMEQLLEKVTLHTLPMFATEFAETLRQYIRVSGYGR